MSYRTCRRCSVTRVNILCELYERGFIDGEAKARKDLTRLTNLAVERGYPQGSSVLHAGLNEAMVRSLCWNISSLLDAEDMKLLGLDGGNK